MAPLIPPTNLVVSENRAQQQQDEQVHLPWKLLKDHIWDWAQQHREQADRPVVGRRGWADLLNLYLSGGPGIGSQSVASELAEVGSRPVNPPEFNPQVRPSENNLDDVKTKAPIAGQCTAEANPQRVHAAQNDNDVPPTEANLAPLEAESKLPPKENLDEKTKTSIAVQYIAQANSERVHAAQNDNDVPAIEANLAPWGAESNLPPKEGELEQLSDRSKILLNGASPIISVNQSCEGNKDGEAEHSCKGNSDDKSNELSTVGREGNVPGVLSDLLQKEDVALGISGHEKFLRQRVKKDAIKVDNSFSALMDDPEIEEQEEAKRQEETEKKQRHGHPRSEKKKRKSPASEVNGPDSQWSSLGVLSLSLVCFLLLLAAVYTRQWT